MRKESAEIEAGKATSRRPKRPKTQTNRASIKSTSRAKPAGRATKKSGTATRRAAPGKTAGQSQSTTDHETIRQWAESRGGTPTSVKGTARSKEHVGLLRIDFPGFSGEGTLEPVEWDEWFERFDESKLAFLYQDKTKDGKQSRFFKLVKR
ncbi:MAG: 1,4-alpha-glucan branching enzyme [Verrucomicrobiales bacterium]|nr:1,4-alpha-glucan branching enzyme [Verrucomicrobiales bacterium]